MARLDGKVAIVTGGSAGIGEAIVKKFVQDGAKVVVIDLADTNETPSKDVVFVKGDCSDEETWKKALDAALKNFGRVDIVCNNAGITNQRNPIKLAHEIPISLLEKMFQIHLKAHFVSAQVVFPYFIENKIKGVMVNSISTGAFRPRMGGSFYAATKAGAAGAIKALANEYAQFGIRVCGVAPSTTRTAMGATREGGLANASDEMWEKRAKELPLGIIAEPEDIANMVAHLASDESRVVTGIVVPVDSGRLL